MTQRLYTIGFAKKTARDFFELLRAHGIKRLVDIRRNNTSQMAGFTKKPDLEYFLEQILSAEYHHLLLLAPDPDLLKAYRAKAVDWDEFERRYIAGLAQARVEEKIPRDLLLGVPTVLLCSEPEPDFCHRRLAAEYLRRAWGDFEIWHL